MPHDSTDAWILLAGAFVMAAALGAVAGAPSVLTGLAPVAIVALLVLLQSIVKAGPRQ
jgi:hypothetical protein